MCLWLRQGGGDEAEEGSADGEEGVGLAEGGLAGAAVVMQDGSEDGGEGGEVVGPTILVTTKN